jgi:MoaA/NifB/PqqE/SkfB family radical SAM enzyme
MLRQTRQTPTMPPCRRSDVGHRDQEAAMIVVWRVVQSCDLSCPFCAFDKRLSFARAATDPAEIARFTAVLADHQAATGDRVLVSWLGGEPLLWRPLHDLSLAVRALGLSVSATTNGTPLGGLRLRRHLCDVYKELTISVDGFSSFHDPMRGWAGGFEKLRVWVPALAREARLRGSALKLRANVVLMHQNIADFPRLCLELADWGITEISFNQLGGRDRPEFYAEHRLRPADVDFLEAELPETRARLGEHGASVIGGANYVRRIRASALDQRNPVDDCGPGESFLFIDETGLASPCSFTTADYGVALRTITTASDLAALPARFRRMRAARRSMQCDDCLSTQVCDKFKATSGDRRTAVPTPRVADATMQRHRTALPA